MAMTTGGNGPGACAPIAGAGEVPGSSGPCADGVPVVTADDRSGSRHRRRRESAPLLSVLVALDSFALAAAWMLAHGWSAGAAVPFGRAVAVTVASVVAARASGLYLPNICGSRQVELARVTRVAVASGMVALTVPWLAGTSPDVWVVVAGVALAFAFLTTGRGFYRAWLAGARVRGSFVQPIAVVAYGLEAARLVELVANAPHLGLRICALAGDRATAVKYGLPWIGAPREAADAIAGGPAAKVLMSPAGMAPDEFNAVSRQLLDRGLEVDVATGLWRVDHRRLDPVTLANESFFSLAPQPPALPRGQLACKRLFDVVVASAAVAALAPVLLLVVSAVKLGDGGPVLFRQARVGRGGRVFTLLKFRTMVVDAELRVGELGGVNLRQPPLFKVDADTRVTRVGRFLRAASLDELPQLLNVLGGSMSLVGPRPALPSEAATFDDELQRRHAVRPGITGLWQVEARENPSFYAYRHLDLFYIENWSWSLDLVLLLSTVPAVAVRAVRALFGGREIVVDLTAAASAAGDGLHLALPAPEC